MRVLDDRQCREAFHFFFFERLLSACAPRSFALKGGVNLRFFFRSPRYSEDMDVDVRELPVHKLRDVGYRILRDKSLARSLLAFGVQELRLNDPAKAKQTETTQRFRLRLVNQSGEELPTKIEFSRRRFRAEEVIVEPMDVSLAQTYGRLAYPCPHYGPTAAVEQKVGALASRSVPQARDVFDLYVLFLGGHVNPTFVKERLRAARLEPARERVVAFSYDDFRGQVVEYLQEEERARFGSKDCWARIQETVFDLLS